MMLESIKEIGCKDKGLYRFSPVILMFLLFPLLSPFPCSAQTPISFGETITATLNAAGEQDLYSFQAQAGDVVLLVVTTTTSLDPYVRVYGPDEALLYTWYIDNGPGLAGGRTSPLATTGTYKVVVSDYGDGTETGSYGIFVQRTNNPGRSTSIGFGETISASIDVVGQVGTYTFNANAGDKVLVRMSTTDLLDPSISYYDPDGTWLGYWTVAGPGTLEFVINPIPKTGRYTVLPRDDQWNETGSYTISVQRLNNPGMATTIAFGETILSSISAAGEIDTYSFDAKAGDKVWVEMSTRSNLDPHVRLYDPDGVLVQEAYANSGPWSTPIWVTLLKTGAYRILASDYGDGTETGEYGIYVQRLNNPGMTTPVSFGETTSASLDKVCDVDTYTFEGVEGDIIIARMSTTSYLDPELIFCAPDGSVVSWWYAIGPGTVEFTSAPLPATGTYKILAVDYTASSTKTGDYWLSVQRLNNPGMAVPIGFGETLSGFLSEPGEMDCYTFDAISGDIVLMAMATDTMLDPYIRVYGPDGVLLYTWYNENGPGVAGSYTSPLPATGTYKVLVGDYGDGTETGAYGFFVQRVNNPSLAIPLVFSETVTGSIDLVGERDTYTFDAVEGDVIGVRISTTSLYLDSTISVYDPDGAWLSTWTRTGPGTLEFVSNPIPKSGRYTLFPRDDFMNETGSYTITVLRANNPEKAYPITFGQEIQASIQKSNEVDTYTFEAIAGDVALVIMSTTSSLDPYVRVYGPDGASLYTWYIENGPGVAGGRTAPLPTTGTYKVVVGDYGDGTETGSYGILVQRMNNPGMAKPLAFGETVTASIDLIGEMDTYTFDAVAGDVVLVRVSASNIYLDPLVNYYDPDGNRLQYWWHTGPGTVEFTTGLIPRDGTYKLLVSDDYANELGPYTISVQRLNNPGMAVPIGFGETISASLSAPGEMDCYTFDAIAGDIVIMTMATANMLDPYIRVYGPDGSLLATAYAENGPGAAGLRTSPLPATGTYLVVAGEYGDGIETGTYGFFVQRVNNPRLATPLFFGETLAASIDVVAECDTYTFDAVEGDVIGVRMSTTSPSLDPSISIYDPDGTWLGYWTKTGPGTLEFVINTVPKPGRYTFLPRDDQWNETGSYTITVLRANNPARAWPINFGQEIEASIQKNYEVDSYNFDAIAGDKVLVRMAANGDALDPHIRLYGPNGVLLTEVSSGYPYYPRAVELASGPLPSTGTYTVLVDDGTLDGETGDYLFYVQRLNNPAVVIPALFGVGIQGSVQMKYEVDTYTFDAIAGDKVLVRMAANGTELDPHLRLYGPNGALVGEVYSGSPYYPRSVELTNVSLPSTGTYAVLVDDGTLDGETGDYLLYVERLNNPPGVTAVSFGVWIQGVIQTGYEADTYTFDAIAGDKVLVRMAANGTALDPHIRLYGPDGKLLKEAYAGYPFTARSIELASASLPSQGKYTVQVDDAFGDGETGDYLFYVQRLNNAAVVTPVSFGVEIQGAIQTKYEVNTYTFDAIAGDKVLVRMAANGPALDPHIRLYGPDGTLLKEAYAGYPYNARSIEIQSPSLPITGTYTVLISDAVDDGENGDYLFYVQRLNSPAVVTPVSFGVGIQGAIQTKYEVNTYTFDAIAGDKVLVRMAANGPALDPHIRLYGPDGTLLKEAYAGYPYTARSMELASGSLPTTGTYTVLVSDAFDDGEIGDYLFYAQRLNNPAVVTQVKFGLGKEGAIQTKYRVNTYTFDAIAEDIVLVRMAANGVALDPHIRLYGPDGTLIKEAYAGYPYNARSIELESPSLPITGTYTVLVSDAFDDGETGDYIFYVYLLRGTPGALSVNPTEGLSSTGLFGGPFSPASLTYTLRNNGVTPLNWELSKTQEWTDISSSSGTLGPAASASVTVTIDSKASNLEIGGYTDTLSFSNLSEGGRTIVRSANLVVKAAQGVLEVTPLDGFIASGTPGGPFIPQNKTYTLKNTGQTAINWQASEPVSWLSLSSPGGGLNPGEQVGVTASITEAANDLGQGMYKSAISFSNTTNGNGNTVRDAALAIGVNASEISCFLSRTSIIIGEPLLISGQIDPAPCTSGAFVDIALVPPVGPEVHRTVIANSEGLFSCFLACDDIRSQGSWNVRASWSGDNCLAGATSQNQDLEVIEAESRVSVNTTSQAIKFDEAVDISGKFTPQPDCGGDLTGIPVELHFSGPEGRSDVQYVTTIDRYGHYVLQDYAGFGALGDWTIQAKFMGNEAYLVSNSPIIHIKVVETAGYAIIVQGKIQSEEGLASHKKTTKFVYNLLKARGLLDDDIKYFTYDTSQPGYDGIPSEAAVQQAITQWARDKMNAKPANLYLIMVDHGFDEAFYVYPDTITSTELDGWVDTLQGSLTGQAAEQEIIMVLGFCRSGSFIDNLSGAHRVIIASAAASESSYKGPLDADSIREGEYFVSEFFKSVAYGKSVKGCFELACATTQRFTASGKLKVNAPYHDDSYQHPLLDDNADGVGSHDLSDPTGDGLLSSTLYIGVSAFTGNDPEDVTVAQATPATFLSEAQTVTDLWAKVSNNTRMDTVWVEIKAPGTTPIDPGGSGQAEMSLPKSVFQSYNSTMNRYEWLNQGTFTNPGMYQILYFAKDTTTLNVSPLVESKVYKAKTGNAPPGAFSLISPNNGDSVLTTLVLDWEDAVDPEGDRVTYAVLLSKGDPGFTNSLRKEGLTYSTCLVGPGDGLEDLSTYYWKVLAIDEYGAIRESDVRVFNTNNTNPVMGLISGHVYNGITKEDIMNAVVSIGGWSFHTGKGGYYLGQVPPMTDTITASAIGYKPQSFSGVTIGDGAVVSKEFALTAAARPGDLNGDNAVDMADCILAIRIMNGANAGAADVMAADVNGDGKIGLQDVIYILQKAAGLR
jgi:hypothetical protein